MAQSMMSTNTNQNPFHANTNPGANPGMQTKKMSARQIIAIALLVLGIIFIAVAVLIW